MNRILLVVMGTLMCMAFRPLAAAAQEPPRRADTARTYTDEFRRGVEALQAGRFEEGVAAMKRCLELAPEDPSSAYNLACAYALQGQVEPGIEWFAKSAEWGFGYDPFTDLVALADKDSDLDALRKDARFAPLLEKIHARKKTVEDAIGTAASYVPEKAKSGGAMALLVVLHPSGATKESVIQGRWKQVADELGCALLAPSARLLASRKPEQGTVWWTSFADYARPDRSDLYEQSVISALAAFQKANKVDPARVWIAGDVEGGMVALRMAFAHPETWKAVLANDTGLETALLKPHAEAAKKAGLKVKILIDRDAFAKRLAADPSRKVDPAVVLSAWNDNLMGMGFLNALEAWSKDPASPADALTPKLVASLRAMQPAAVDAATPK
jgi:predicted esterase